MLEVCVDSIESVKNATTAGKCPGRFELCSSLDTGGLTPSIGLVTEVKKIAKNIPIYTMIRPRNGNFVYSKEEIEIMACDIKVLSDSGFVDGFVFGCLTKEGKVDKESCKYLLRLCAGRQVTFHRAIDTTVDILAAVNDVIELGFERILTSGGAKSAEDGIPVLKQMVDQAAGRVIIMAGAGITVHNVARVMKTTGVKEVHGTCKKSVTYPVSYLNDVAEKSINVTCSQNVEQILNCIEN